MKHLRTCHANIVNQVKRVPENLSLRRIACKVQSEQKRFAVWHVDGNDLVKLGGKDGLLPVMEARTHYRLVP